MSDISPEQKNVEPTPESLRELYESPAGIPPVEKQDHHILVQRLNESIQTETAFVPEQHREDKLTATEPARSRKGLIAGGVAAVVGLGVAAALMLGGGDKEEKVAANPTPATDQESTPTTATPTTGQATTTSTPETVVMGELTAADLAPIFVDENDDPLVILDSVIEKIETLHNSKLPTDATARQALLDRVFTRTSTEDRNQVIARNSEITTLRQQNPERSDIYYDWEVNEAPSYDQESADGLTRTITGIVEADGPVDITTSRLSALLSVEVDPTTGRDVYLIDDILEHTQLNVVNKPDAFK